MATIIAIFIFLIVMGLSINTVKAGQNYNSSKSNTATSIGIGKIHEYVGNILLPYGIGGLEINRVNDAIDVGITEDALRVMLYEIVENNVVPGTASGESVSDKVQAILLEFDKLGIGTTGDTPQAGFKEVSGIGSETESIEIKDGDDLPATEKGTIREILPSGPSKRAELAPAVTTAEIVRENAKELRENFRENVRTTIGHVDHGKTARIAVAHSKGLRMINRYRSAIARFDHILGRMESRIDKIGIEIEARAAKDGMIKEAFPPTSVLLLIEEVKNMQVENEAKLVELEAKYESLLEGEKATGQFIKLGHVKGEISQGIGEEARAIAKELKAEIENLHAKLRQIADEIRLAAGTDFNSSIAQ